MEVEGAWQSVKGIWRRLFYSRERPEPLTSSSPSPPTSTRASTPSSSSSRNSYLSAVEWEFDEPFGESIPLQPLRRGTRDHGKGGYVPLHVPKSRRRDSHSISPCRRFSLVGERKHPVAPSTSLKGPLKGAERSRSEDRRLSRAARGSIAPSTLRLRARSEEPPTEPEEELEDSTSEKSDDDEENVSSAFGSCEAERRLETLIRDRGYHVKEHVPRRQMEERIMNNIRRRERIAIMMRNEAAKNAGIDRTISTADELTTAATSKKTKSPERHQAPRVSERLSRPLPTPRPISEGVYVDPLRLQNILGLVSKVWTKRSSAAAPPSNKVVEWARQEFIGECLQEHNRCRQLHGVPQLHLCDRLSEDAQIWADKLAQSKIIEFSSKDGRGENILMSSAVSRGGFTGIGVTKAWYDKGRKFNYSAAETADMAQIGSFTQVIWRDTRRIGIGMSRSECGRIVAVARYSPKGNIPGEVKDNVLPLVRVNPFDLPTFSKTREEANLNVQTALVAPEICAGVARFYATPIKEPSPNPRRTSWEAMRYSKMNGLYSPRREKPVPKRTSRMSGICPDRKLIQVCCGAPSLAESPQGAVPNSSSPSPVVTRTPSNEPLRVLSPSSLEGENRGALRGRRNPFNTLSDEIVGSVDEIDLHTLPPKKVKITTKTVPPGSKSGPLKSALKSVPARDRHYQTNR